MNDTILRELREGKVTLASSPPKCIHSLGAIAKKDGTLRPITDCKRPLKLSINNHMVDTCDTFSYRGVDFLTEMLNPKCPESSLFHLQTL